MAYKNMKKNKRDVKEAHEKKKTVIELQREIDKQHDDYYWKLFQDKLSKS